MRHAHRGFVLLAGVFLGMSSSGHANNSVQSQQRILDEALSNPYAKYYSRQDIDNINATLKRQMIKGQMMVIDTRDEAACKKLQAKLEQSPNMIAAGGTISDICRFDPTYPYTSVVIMRETNENEFRKDINFGKLTSDEKNIFTATRNLGVAGLGAAGILYMLPERVTKWDRDKIRGNLDNKWKGNVKEGPIWDQDDDALNYVGHPVAGAAYYQVARHLDLTPMQSFGYSVFMSTFFWEYGVESFAEVPSIQDLIVTPIIGSLLGEAFFRLERNIQENNGKVWGSETLGKVCMVLLNPAGALSDQINKIFGSKIIKESKSRLIMRPQDPYPGAYPQDRKRMMIGIEVEFLI